MKVLAILIGALIAPLSFAQTNTAEWQKASLVEKRTVNEWCRHCPDWNKTRYSLQTNDGMIYVAETHSILDVAINGHNSLRVEKNGHVGAALHIRDDAGKEHKLRIVERIAPK